MRSYLASVDFGHAARLWRRRLGRCFKNGFSVALGLVLNADSGAEPRGFQSCLAYLRRREARCAVSLCGSKDMLW